MRSAEYPTDWREQPLGRGLSMAMEFMFAVIPATDLAVSAPGSHSDGEMQLILVRETTPSRPDPALEHCA
jgi:hypothetical protein